MNKVSIRCLETTYTLYDAQKLKNNKKNTEKQASNGVMFSNGYRKKYFEYRILYTAILSIVKMKWRPFSGLAGMLELSSWVFKIAMINMVRTVQDKIDSMQEQIGKKRDGNS